jgi:hypothetical protein
MADPANQAQNASTGVGPGQPSPTPDAGVAPEPSPLEAGQFSVGNLKSTITALNKLGVEGQAASSALNSVKKMQDELNEKMQEEIKQKEEIIKREKERIEAEEKLKKIRREMAETEQEFAAFRKADGTMTEAASVMYQRRMRSLNEDMVKANKTVAESTVEQRKAEQSYAEASKRVTDLAISIRTTVGTLDTFPDDVKKAFGKAVENITSSLDAAVDKTAKSIEESSKRIEKNREKAQEASLKATMEDEREVMDATRKGEMRRLKSVMASKAGDLALEAAEKGGIVGVSEIAAAQESMKDFTEGFKKFKGGREVTAAETLQFDAIAKMLQKASASDIDALTPERIEAALQKAGYKDYKLTEDMKELLADSVKATKEARASGEAADNEVIIAMGTSLEKIDTLQKNIVNNSKETINLMKQEKVNELIKQGIKADQAARIVASQSATRGSALQIAIAQEEKRAARALMAVNESGNDALVLGIGQMSENQKQSIETAVEDRFTIPKWAGTLIGAYQNSIGVMQEEFGRLAGLFGGSGSFTKVLMVAGLALGVVVGYIWSYFQKVWGVISMIPKLFSFLEGRFLNGILMRFGFGAVEKMGSMLDLVKKFFMGGGKMIMGTFAMIGNAIKFALVKPIEIFGKFLSFLRIPTGAGGLVGTLGNVFKSITGVFSTLVPGIRGVGQAIPFVGRFLGFIPQIAGAFKLGFSLASKFFPPLFAIVNIITAIVGAFRGFGQGGIKGAIIGAIAQVISGFTFGILNFQDIFDFLNSALGPIIEGLIDVLQYAYKVVLKPFVDFIMQVFQIFKGEGGFATKIIKVITAGMLALLKYALGVIILLPIKIAGMLTTAFLHIVKFLVIDIPMMLFDAAMWFWNWITSGEWLADINNFGTWVLDKLKEFWYWLLDSIAEAFAGFPVIGPYIAGKIKPSDEDKEKEIVKKALSDPLKEAAESASIQQSTAADSQRAFASNMANYPTAGTGIPASSISVTAGRVMTNTGVPLQTPYATSAAAVQMARAQAQSAGKPGAGGVVQVNGGTTNVLGGGGSAPLLPIPPNRNPDPTYRALLFMEAPAL